LGLFFVADHNMMRPKTTNPMVAATKIQSMLRKYVQKVIPVDCFLLVAVLR
jgi:hypothetical protein